MNLSGPFDVSKRSNIISSAKESVARVIDSHSEESIQAAIRSFEWAFSAKELSAISQQAVIQPAGFAESPANYLAGVAASGFPLSRFNEIVSTEDVQKILRGHAVHFQHGVKAFLQCGLREALGSMKIHEHPKEVQLSVPPPLNELLLPEKLKSADQPGLQASVQAIHQMFSTLKTMHEASTDLKANMLQFLRC